MHIVCLLDGYSEPSEGLAPTDPWFLEKESFFVPISVYLISDIKEESIHYQRCFRKLSTFSLWLTIKRIGY